MLRTIKGEFDGIYTSQKDFNLIDFHCRKLFSQFDTISGNSKIIFFLNFLKYLKIILK